MVSPSNLQKYSSHSWQWSFNSRRGASPHCWRRWSASVTRWRVCWDCQWHVVRVFSDRFFGIWLFKLYTNSGSGYLVVKMLFFPCCQCCHWSLSLVSKFIYVYHTYIQIYVYYIQTWLYTSTVYIQLIFDWSRHHWYLRSVNRNWKRRWDRCRSDVAGVLPMPAKTTAFQKIKIRSLSRQIPRKMHHFVYLFW